jgi:hypothetical protein
MPYCCKIRERFSLPPMHFSIVNYQYRIIGVQRTLAINANAHANAHANATVPTTSNSNSVKNSQGFIARVNPCVVELVYEGFCA